MHNPLLETSLLPTFSTILPEHIEPALDQLLAENRAKLAELLTNNHEYSWENLLQPFEDISLRLDQMWSIVSHLNKVVNNEDLRKAYNACLPKITAYSTELGQNETLYAAYNAISKSVNFAKLSKAQQKVITDAIRDFHLAGVNLPANEKLRYKEIQEQLAKEETKFEENILDATDGWTNLVTDEALLAGLPDHAINAAKQHAEKQKQEGWLFTLDFPSYYAVITYADNRELREKTYTAYVTRASDVGPNAGKWDNSQSMVTILKLRQEEAKLIGYNNYAEVSLVQKMAKSTQQVDDFLAELAHRSHSMAKKEWRELQDFAQQQSGTTELKPWDVAYFSEKLRQSKFNISQEALRPYFPIEQVLTGMFAVVNKLYGITIKQRQEKVDVWHSDVRFFDVYDSSGELIAGFYIDLYARSQKRSGAWMDGSVVRHRFLENNLQLPICFLICNFSAPQNDKPALLTHEEIETLFHEFGHGLHHTLTKMDFASISGTHGVAWDAVELPSQFMENWCWQKASLDLISSHYQTGEKLPEEYLNKLLAAKNFQSAMQMIRQLEFSIFDFKLHQMTDIQQTSQIQKLLDEIRREIAVVPTVPFNRFQHSFSHIFAGGYAAGYYSYKWAEVLSCDAFTQFEKNGIFDCKTGLAFLHTILEKGGGEEAMDLFIAFMGRAPKIDPLLKHAGIMEH